jgi:hypothetical protein
MYIEGRETLISRTYTAKHFEVQIVPDLIQNVIIYVSSNTLRPITALPHETAMSPDALSMQISTLV